MRWGGENDPNTHFKAPPHNSGENHDQSPTLYRHRPLLALYGLSRLYRTGAGMKNPRKLRTWMRLEHGRASNTARACGVSRQAVSAWVLGTSTPTPEKRDALDRLTKGKIKADDWPYPEKPGPKAKT